MKNFSLLLIFSLYAFCSFSQDDGASKVNRANTLYNKATMNFQSGELTDAEKNLLEAIRLDSTFYRAYTILAELYIFQKKKEKCIETLLKNAIINGYNQPDAIYYLGLAHLNFGDYEDAKKQFERLYNDRTISGNIRNTIAFQIKVCEFAITAINNPVPFHPVNLGPEVNSSMSEYLPTLTTDEQTLLITVMEPKPGTTGEKMDDFQEDFYISKKVNGKWTKAVNLGPPVNSAANEGAQTISPDGQLIFFTACMRKDGYGDCDLYYTRKTGNVWSEPRNMGKTINTSFRESEPTMASDGITLYFVSDRPGGKGQFDLWMTQLNDKGYWSRPVNMGPEINTDGIEMSPFIHPDGNTLYFTSTGHMGMGNRDIFLARKEANGKWQKPVNLGYPINTFEDEADMIVNARGDMAYFSSRRDGGYGESDLYMFELYEGARPVTVTYVKGIVYDAESKDKLEARFELIDLESGALIVEAYSDASNGEFLVSLAINKEYAMNVSRDGYLFYSANFSLNDLSDTGKTFLLDVPLQKIMIGEKVVLKNIFFDTDSYELKPESTIELTKLLTFMQKNPSITVEISGHTDNVGSDQTNQTLSEDRAKSVTEFLIAKGVDTVRMTYKGYGETQPIDDNATEPGKANNRRTEFKITKQ